jgi:site-specific recombinase XerD
MNYLTIQQVEKTLEIAMEKSARDHLLLLLCFRHGMRRSEAASLTLNDIKNGQIHIARLKGSLTTKQPLLASENDLFDEIRAIERWLQFRPANTNFLFPGYKGAITGSQVGNIAKYYLERAGVPKELCHAHIFKHSFCSITLRNGATIEYIAQAVGHADIKSTRIYLNVTDSEASEVATKALSIALRKQHAI